MVDTDRPNNGVEIAVQIRHIAKRLREEREKRHISQMDLSFRAGLSQNQVNYIENGKRTPTMQTFLSICKALRINPSIVFEAVNESENEAERRNARETIIRLVSQFM